MYKYIETCPHCGYQANSQMPLPLEIMVLNNMSVDCGKCGKEFQITKETFSPYTIMESIDISN